MREDPELGPIFNGAIHDWDHHMDQLTAFWSSVMLGTGRYKGQPMPAHFRHRAKIEPRHFARWLALWHRTAGELLEPGAADAVGAKAERIGESLMAGLFYRPGERDPAR